MAIKALTAPFFVPDLFLLHRSLVQPKTNNISLPMFLIPGDQRVRKDFPTTTTVSSWDFVILLVTLCFLNNSNYSFTYTSPAPKLTKVCKEKGNGQT